MCRLFRRLLTHEAGQDLIEYALLATFVGLVGIAAFSRLEAAIGTAYAAYISSTNNNWQMPDPGGS
jgi:Flp pilus assembly pilin Flp